MKLAAFIYLAVALLCSARAATTADFPTVVNYNFLNDGTIEIPGRLFQPSQATANPTQKFPLVIFLHGSGEAGSDNLAQIDSNIDNLLAAGKANGFYIYAPQSTETVQMCWNQFWRLNDALLVAGQLVRDYNIDPNRVYITGLSDGGGGTDLIFSNATNMLAAAVSISDDDAVIGANLVDKPIWYFHSRDDPTEPVAYSRNNVNAIRLADPTLGTALTFPLVGSQYYSYYASYAGTGTPEDGASFYSLRNLNYSEYTSGGHGIWIEAYAESPLYTWLLAQSLSGDSTPLTQPAAGEQLLFDFGPTITGTVSNQVWNSPGGTSSAALPMAGAGTGTGTEQTIAPAVVFAYASTGHRTPVILSVTKPFNGVSTGTSASTLYPASVTSEGWEQGGLTSNANSIANPAELLLSGLTPSALYSVTTYGSDNSANNNSLTRYTIDNSASIYADLTTRGNVNNYSSFAHIAADSNGEIRIEVAPVPSSVATAYYANISALTVAPVTTLSYSAWESNYFGTDTVRGAATATPMNDGVTNILKYFCNINPSQLICAKDRAALPTAGLATVNNVSYLTLTYRQSATLTGLTVQAETSSDLQSWQNATPTVLSSTTDPITNDTLVVTGVPTSGATHLFTRLVFSGY